MLVLDELNAAENFIRLVYDAPLPLILNMVYGGPPHSGPAGTLLV